MTKKNIHGKFLEQIQEQVKKVHADDYVMPWDTSLHTPQNPLTEKAYNGINRVILSCDASDRKQQPVYATFKQWQKLGHPVLKGAKSTVIVRPQQYKQKIQKDGEEETLPRMIFLHFCVFHYSQVEGYTPKTYENNTFTSVQSIENFISKVGAKIEEGITANYNKTEDFVQMPPKSSFMGTSTSTAQESYYSTLFHELIHWTGAKHRLNRKQRAVKYSNS